MSATLLRAETERSDQTAGDTYDVPKGYEWAALSVTTLGALLASLQGTALMIALPDIILSLNMSFLTMMWVLTGYLLLSTAIVPLVGRLADMWGRKFLYNTGFAVFTFGSLLCGLSQAKFEGADMIVFRLVQAIGAALLFTNSAAIVTDAFRRGRVGLGIGINQIAFGAGFIVGPFIGGMLTAISWRWVFLYNVPLGIFGTYWGIRQLREPVTLPAHQSFDWKGSLTFTSGLGAALFGLTVLAFPAVSSTMAYSSLALGLVILAAFVVLEFRERVPMIDLRLFADRLFGFANLSCLINSVARGAVIFVLIFFLQGPYGKDPLTAGIMLAPFGIAFVAVGPLSGYFSDRYGARVLSTVGLAITTLGLWGMSTLEVHSPYQDIAVWSLLMGGGSGLFQAPNANVVMSSVRPDQRGVAAGIRMMLMNVGQMFSMAFVIPIVLGRLSEDVTMRIFVYGGGMGGDQTVIATFMAGFRQALVISCAISVLAIIASVLQPSHSPRALARSAQ